MDWEKNLITGMWVAILVVLPIVYLYVAYMLNKEMHIPEWGPRRHALVTILWPIFMVWRLVLEALALASRLIYSVFTNKD